MAKLKLKSVAKITLIIFVLIFGGLFVIANFSTALVDWQFYKAEKLGEKCSGIYVFDKDLYAEAEKIGIYPGLGIGVIPSQEEGILSNNFLLEAESLRMNTKYSRISIVGYTAFYTDNNGNKHIIYQAREYIQEYFALYIGGDEGGGIRVGTSRLYHIPYENNLFYVENMQEEATQGVCKYE